MKKALVILALCLAFGTASYAQRFAYVDTQYILRHIPEYISAQKQLDALSLQWQKETENRMAELDKLYKSYQADQVLLTDEMRKRRENEIVEKEKGAKDFQNLKFGFEGDLFKEKIRLVKPIQERVAKALQTVAENRQMDMIFDKSSEVTLLYASPRLDLSNDVITRLGYKPGTFAEGVQ